MISSMGFRKELHSRGAGVGSQGSILAYGGVSIHHSQHGFQEGLAFMRGGRRKLSRWIGLGPRMEIWLLCRAVG